MEFSRSNRTKPGATLSDLGADPCRKLNWRPPLKLFPTWMTLWSQGSKSSVQESPGPPNFSLRTPREARRQKQLFSLLVMWEFRSLMWLTSHTKHGQTETGNSLQLGRNIHSRNVNSISLSNIRWNTSSLVIHRRWLYYWKVNYRVNFWYQMIFTSL